MNVITTIRLGAMTTAATVALASCAAFVPGGTSDDYERAADQPVSTELSDDEVTIRVAFTNGPEMMERYIAEFEQLHPQVTVEAEYTEFSAYSKNVNLMMTSGSAPDIAQYNVGMKELIAAREILPLDAYRDAYTWDEKFSVSGLDMLRFSDNGKVFGTGQLYGVPAGMSETGIFVNKKLAAEVGIELPIRDLAGLESAMDRALDAGITPMAVGALDSGGLHLWSNLLNVMMPKEDYRDWVNGTPGGDITGPEALAATRTLTEWSAKGYFAAGANADGQAQSTANFTQGKSIFLLNGNWAAAQIAEEMGDAAGFFTMPGGTPDQPATSSGSTVSFVVSNRTEHADVAAAFLDYLGSESAGRIASDGGFLPPNTETTLELSGVRADLLTAYVAVVAADGMNRFPDSAAPNAYDRLVSGIQALIQGSGDPVAFLDEIQQIRDEYHAG
jgi:ABC-type glycerol-3-phosphate transport system substrate-binding protein